MLKSLRSFALLYMGKVEVPEVVHLQGLWWPSSVPGEREPSRIVAFSRRCSGPLHSDWISAAFHGRYGGDWNSIRRTSGLSRRRSRVRAPSLAPVFSSTYRGSFAAIIRNGGGVFRIRPFPTRQIRAPLKIARRHCGLERRRIRLSQGARVMPHAQWRAAAGERSGRGACVGEPSFATSPSQALPSAWRSGTRDRDPRASQAPVRAASCGGHVGGDRGRWRVMPGRRKGLGSVLSRPFRLLQFQGGAAKAECGKPALHHLLQVNRRRARRCGRRGAGAQGRLKPLQAAQGRSSGW